MHEYMPNASRNIWSSHKERHADVEFVWHGFAFHESILAKMIAMVWRVDDICVVQLSENF